ncbi:DUF6895 family protein [Kitasatospora sp. NPDC051853]|uniref:DUF6895 family protein n=1 Tax=Kitasatospora sp. NPDC051853 TaxID=3364058 RepID=UPI00378EC8ED
MPTDIAEVAPPAGLRRVGDGALDWLERHLAWFDPFSPQAGASAHGTSAHGKAKAALELALLRHCWARTADEGDPRFGRVTNLVRTLWRQPEVRRLVTAVPAQATYYGLVHAALDPDGPPDGTVLDRAAVDGLSPYLRLELRYYGDQARARHDIESYAELAERNVLVTLPAVVRERAVPERTAPDGEPPVSIPQAYAVTHSSYYLTDFGRTAPPLSAEQLTGARELVRAVLEHCVRRDWWDLAAELMMAQVCLGERPLDTPWGRDALACLARAQRPDGAIPGRSANTAAPPSAPAGEFFAAAYHTTLVTALMALLVSSAGAR